MTAAYGPVAEWDVSKVTNFSYLFNHEPDLTADLSDFTADLSGWDVERRPT